MNFSSHRPLKSIDLQYYQQRVQILLYLIVILWGVLTLVAPGHIVSLWDLDLTLTSFSMQDLG